MGSDFIMEEKKRLIYGVQYIKGKIIATIFEKEEDVPYNQQIVYEENLADYIERLNSYNTSYRNK